MSAPLLQTMYFAILLTAASLTLAAPSENARANAGTAASSSTQGTGLAIDHYSIDNGAGTSNGGAFSISGSIGQADADPLQPSTGGAFAITGGFHPGTGAPPLPTIFGNGFEGN